ncbi:hypothetical protein [Bradyrhizobium prioriisuperbiae]|uniref:hypothetical protein n=1 Tax=Bradyrhizobium prioriisuperbiae TaxID=2854389 RepID=UPI0028E312BE|nr:hypothetical protein [Bradyrhizobium prioritasuperba]
MADPNTPSRSGYYGCFIGTTPFFGLGGGFCADLDGNIYPQVAWGVPGFSASAGHASDLNEYLTGPSIGVGGSGMRVGSKIDYHAGGNATSIGGGIGVGTPGAGIGATYGLPPFNIHDVPSYISKLPTLLYPRGGVEPNYSLI